MKSFEGIVPSSSTGTEQDLRRLRTYGTYTCQTNIAVHGGRKSDKTAGTGGLDSAIYFTGANMNRHRVMNLTKQRDGATTYKKVVLRDAWVKRLDENTIELNFTNEEKNDLLKWARTFKMTTEDLEVCLSRKPWRKGLIKTNNYQVELS